MNYTEAIRKIEDLQQQVALLQSQGVGNSNQHTQRVKPSLDDLRTTLNELRTGIEQQRPVNKEIQDQIKRAKQEWEATADSLSELVCLVDDQGHIMRANRRLESWNLGDVTEIWGRKLHEVLHAGCTDPDCYLVAFWQEVQQELSQGHSAEYETNDKVLGRHLRIRARPILAHSGHKRREIATFAVVVVYDITEYEHAKVELERSRELATLNLLTTVVSRSIELPEVLNTLTSLMAEQLGIPAGAIHFYDSTSDRLYLQAAWGLPQTLLNEIKVLPVTALDNERVIHQRMTVLKADYRDALRRLDLGPDVTQPEWQSYLSVPLIAKGETQGTLAVFSQASEVFDEDQITFFEALGRHVGVAIQNARWYEAEQKARQVAETLHSRLQQLTQQVVVAQENERRRIAYELHDEAGQALTALTISLEMLREALPVELESLRHQTNEALQMVDSTTERIQMLAQGLRPPALDAVGLNLALEDFCRTFARRTRLSITYAGTDLPALPDPIEITLYRFLQEALNNVAKHAQANHVSVELSYNGGTISVAVEDDGHGFVSQTDISTTSQSPGMGLIGMRERVELLGGHVESWSQTGEGSRLVAHVPVRDTE